MVTAITVVQAMTNYQSIFLITIKSISDKSINDRVAFTRNLVWLGYHHTVSKLNAWAKTAYLGCSILAFGAWCSGRCGNGIKKDAAASNKARISMMICLRWSRTFIGKQAPAILSGDGIIPILYWKNAITMPNKQKDLTNWFVERADRKTIPAAYFSHGDPRLTAWSLGRWHKIDPQ